MAKIVDFPAAEDVLTPSQAKRVKMTKQQKREYKLYQKGCRFEGVEPVRADFLNGEIPSCVTNWMELEQNEKEWERRKVRAAAAGR